MMSVTLLASLLLGIDVICGNVGSSACSLNDHINSQTEWGYTGHVDYKGDNKGKDAANAPLPRMSPFNDETEEEINKQINRELFAHYTYLSMAMHFDRDDINLPGFHKFFKESAEEEMEHAKKFMKYQNKRGGRVKLYSIMTPCKDQWGNGLDAMTDALNLEKMVYEALLGLHSKAEESKDAPLQDFLESHYLDEQVDSIKELSNYVNTLTRLNESCYSLGEYQFDKHTLGGKKD